MTLEKVDLAVEICKNLPFGLTILADNRGCCQRYRPDCPYCRFNLDQDLQVCDKKTTTLLPLPRISF